MAIKRDVQPSPTRRVARQMHRNNVPADTAKEYFKRSLAIPLLDNFIYELEFRFNDLSERSSKGSFKRYVTPEGGGRVVNFVTNRYGNQGGGEGVSVMPLRNVDNFFIWPISRETYL